MRHSHLTLLLVALACTSGPAMAGTDAATASAAAEKKKGEKVVCTTEEVVGSRRPKRVCMTRAQRAQITQDSKQALSDMTARSGSNQPQ